MILDAGALDAELCQQAQGSHQTDAAPLVAASADAGADDDAGSDDDAGVDSDAGVDGDAGFSLPEPFPCEGEADLSAPARMPRNVLFFLGDGMGPGQVEAARRLAPLHMDTLSAHGWLNSDSLTTDANGATATDSAASATAFATGVRTQNGRLGLDAIGQPVQSVLDLAQQKGKAVGLVTTSYLYDASPMAFAVHVDDRFANGEIVEQLFARMPIDVLMGGGAALLGEALPAVRQRAHALGYSLALSAFELGLLKVNRIDRLLGLFAPSPDTATAGFPTTPVCDRDERAGDPSLSEMTTRALALLSRDRDGFFLFVENENPDAYGHASFNDPELSASALPHEVHYLDAAIGVGLRWVEKHSSFDETLIVVTSDHDTGGFDPGPHANSEATFQTSAHTRIPVHIYAEGPGAKSVKSMCRMSEVYLLLSGRAR